MKIPLRLLFLSLLFAIVSFPLRAADPRVYELRIYTAAPGKLEALLTRFRDHTCKLFEKHGMANIGYWVPLQESEGSHEKLYYLLAFPSREAAKASWAEFRADPEWQAVSKASEANGKIVLKTESIFLSPADFSPALATHAEPAPRLFELRTYTANEGKLAAFETRYREHTLALYARHGITGLGYWLPLDADNGAGHTLIMLLSYPNSQAAATAWSDFSGDPAWIKAKADSEKNGKLTADTKVVALTPTDFSPMQ
jgi:hypothetical protein